MMHTWFLSAISSLWLGSRKASNCPTFPLSNSVSLTPGIYVCLVLREVALGHQRMSSCSCQKEQDAMNFSLLSCWWIPSSLICICFSFPAFHAVDFSFHSCTKSNSITNYIWVSVCVHIHIKHYASLIELWLMC